MNRRFRFALLVVIFAVAVGLLEFSYHYLDVLTRGQRQSPLVTFIEEMTGAFSVFVYLPVVIWAIRRFPVDRPRWLRNVPVHFVIVVIGGVLGTSIMWGSRLVLFPLAGLGHYNYGRMPTRYFMEFPTQVLFYLIAASVTTLYDRQQRATQLEKSLTRAQLQNLRLQLQPHFLFNTLNTISSVMYEDVRVADKMIARLSDLLRMSLEQGTAQEVTLEREMEFLRLYVETMKARFEERLNVAMDAAEDTRGALVPPLLLQPLVENSIRHGANPHSSTVNVSVRARRENGSLCLEVRDHGPGLAVAQAAALRRGIGLSNTAERLERLYGGQCLDLRNARDGGLVVTLKVPFHVDSSSTG